VEEDLLKENVQFAVKYILYPKMNLWEVLIISLIVTNVEQKCSPKFFQIRYYVSPMVSLVKNANLKFYLSIYCPMLMG